MITVKVKAITTVKDNGRTYQPGEVFEMEQSLVEPHVKAGQVKPVAGSPKPVKEKQQRSPRDKQYKTGKTK